MSNFANFTPAPVLGVSTLLSLKNKFLTHMLFFGIFFAHVIAQPAKSSQSEIENFFF
jgi:hypothetical protein